MIDGRIDELVDKYSNLDKRVEELEKLVKKSGTVEPKVLEETYYEN